MRRICGMALACGLMLAGANVSHAQDVTAGDPVGFGRKGVSNAFGYGLKNRLGGASGYMPGLYMPVDRADGPQVYYNEAFSPMNGGPSPSIAHRGWRFSPSWGSGVREARGGLFHGRLASRWDGAAR